MSRRPQTSRRVPLFRASYLLWMAIPLALYGAALAFGLPHLIWSYRFTGSHADLANRTYHSCTYLGPHGANTRNSIDGRCPLVRFFREEGRS